jgi:hypothetical protein
LKRNVAVLSFVTVLLASCDFKLRAVDFFNTEETPIEIERYDRLQSRYLTTGDFSALQQMETDYPMETRALIENVLRLGVMDDPDINKKFLSYFQDSTLQVLISDIQAEYANIDDLNEQLNNCFNKLQKEVPTLVIPRFYTQIGSLDESIILGDDMIGISLDKYMGAGYPLYKKHYTLSQRQSMNRKNIAPDCMVFYLLSQYPLENYDSRSQQERDFHMGKMMWVCNRVMGNQFFQMKFINDVDKYQKQHGYTIQQLLEADV